jgi:outer membrane receptor for ferrienterochelin and colicin
MRNTGLLLAVLGLLCLSLPAGAQEDAELEEFDDFDELYLGQLLDVVYSAAKHEQDIGMSPSAIWVITREDIEASGATNIPDLLRQVPGMDVTMTAPFMPGISARVRWTNQNNQFLVLIDGREINMELLGMSLFELAPVILEEIERIEIIRGPGSALYGANALAGVVNITTRPIRERTSGWARLSAGEIGRTEAWAHASTRAGNWGFSLSGGGDYMGTFADPRIMAKRSWKLRAVAEHRWSESERLLLDGGITSGEGIVAAAVGSFEGTLSIRTLRLAYESEDLRGQLYWRHLPASANMDAALEFSGIRLAEFIPFEADTHTVDGWVEWTLPEFWQPLLLIVGGGGRLAYLSSDQLLDGETFTDITSVDYHQTGLDHIEARLGTFVHGEFAPVEWLTITGGTRFDYNTETGAFVSPRLSAVFRPVKDHFLRLGVARAFRKPAFIERRAHLMVEFPDDSPITGAGRDNFLEFMTRVVGNSDLENEEMLAFEAGYLGRFLDGRLTLALDLYFNHHIREVTFDSNIVPDEHGLPDLQESSFMHFNRNKPVDIIGSELSIRFNLTKTIELLATWTHREAFHHHNWTSFDDSPKNLMTLGGRFRTEWGLIGSLYFFTRSEFFDSAVKNPAGLMEPMLTQDLDNHVLVLGRIGWRRALAGNFRLETGIKLFLPISPFSRPYFRFREDGGGIDPVGKNFGGDWLCRMISLYVQGSF